jgi:hypothetical protein
MIIFFSGFNRIQLNAEGEKKITWLCQVHPAKPGEVWGDA